MSEISVENVSTTEMDLNQDLDLGSNSGKYSLDIIDDVIIEEMEYPVLYEEDSDNDLDDSKDDFYKSETPGKDRDDNEAETCKSGTPDKEETCESGTPDKYGEKANFNQIPYGFQQRGHYEHNKMLTDLVDVTYNPRTREFIFLDTRGICTWNKDALENIVVRSMSYPKYQNRLLRKIIYARKYNVYFCLGKDFSLRVLNRDFDETCSVSSDLSSVMFILFNPVRDELITGGVKGTKIWEFRQVADRVWKEIKPMANYALFLKKELTAVGGSWVKKVELDQHLQHLYCCSETDVFCYDMDGNQLFKLEGAHRTTITGCRYSLKARLLVTSSADAEVKVWSLTGGLVTTLRGHAKAITNQLLHPESSSLVMTSSLDGTVRVWSLDVMECLYVMQVATEGVEWMGLTNDKLLWTATRRNLSVWSLNTVASFWALSRCKTSLLTVVHGENKTSRVMAVGEDSSIRMISIEDQKNLSTVLPPPPISPLQHILAVSYLRELNIVYILIRPYEVWLYSTKSDPATRTHVWNLHTMQLMFRQQQKKEEEQEDDSTAPPISRPPSSKKGGLFGHGNSHNHRATATGGMGIEPIVECCSLCSINCPAMYWTEEGFVCADKTMFVLLGMQDGRVLFMDPNVFGMRHFVLQANKDGILDIRYNVADSMLITRCHPRDDVLFQCWRLPSLELLYEVSVATTITDFTIIGIIFLCGHSTGSVQLHELKRVDPLTYSKTSHTSNISDEISDVSSDQGSVMFDETGSVGGKKREHATAVSKVDACHYLEIFVTCSSDGMIKVWDLTKTLQAEIQVDDTLSTVGFLNKKADLLIGFRNHIFFIHHSKVCPSLRQKINQLPEDAFETESDIYEDPAVRYEGAAANPDPIDMQNYLVPFELDFTSDFLEKLTALSTHSTDEDVEYSDSELSMAPTDIYISPIASPRRLSVIDMIISQDFTHRDVSQKTGKGLKRRVKGSRVAFQSPDAGLHFEMPIFGRSPGPSPTPTPPSTPSDFSLSERESESEEYDDEKEKDENDVEKESISETVFKPIDVVTQTTPAKTVKTPEAKVPKKEKKEESRFALSKYKVDIKGLMKADAKKASTKSSTKPSSSSQVNDKKEAVSEEKIQMKALSAKVLQKKQMKHDRSRVIGRSKTEIKKVEKEDEIKTTIESVTDGSTIEPCDSPSSDAEEEATSVDDDEEASEQPQQSPFTISKKQPIKKDQTGQVDKKVSLTQPSQVTTSTTTLMLQSNAEPMRNGAKPGKVIKSTMKTTSAFDDFPINKPTVSVSPTANIENAQTGVEIKGSEVTNLKETQSDSGMRFVSDSVMNIGSGTAPMYKPATRMAIARKYSSKQMHEDSTGADLNENDEEPELMRLRERPQSKGGLVHTSGTRQLPREGSVKRTSDSISTNLRVRSSFKSDSAIHRQGSQDTNDAIYIPTASMDEEEKSALCSEDVQKMNIGERLHAGRRPHTAHVTFKDKPEDLEDISRKYRSCPTTPSDLKKDNVWFEDYQEKLIERHQILKAQREKRVQSAMDNRRLLDLRQRERRRALLGHHDCAEFGSSTGAISDKGLVTRSDTSLHMMKRAQSARSFRSIKTSSSVNQQRPKSAFGKFKEQEDLASEKPFRVRMGKQSVKTKVNPSEVFENTGNKKPLLIKRQLSKSIPGKCRRYVLISHTAGLPLYPKPTTLEGHLLPGRFPNDMKRWQEFEEVVKKHNGGPDSTVMFSGVDDFMNSSWK